MTAYYDVYKGHVLVLVKEEREMPYLDKPSLIKIGYQHAISGDREVLIDTVFDMAKSANDFELIRKLNEMLDMSSDYAYSASKEEVIRTISKSICIERIVLTALLCIAIFSFLYKPEFISDTHAIWFMRSGSLLTVFPYIYELFFSKGRRLLEDAKGDQAYYGMPLAGSLYLSNKFYSSEVWADRYRYALMILGTVIWGYGDLIHAALWAFFL